MSTIDASIASVRVICEESLERMGPFDRMIVRLEKEPWESACRRKIGSF
jgi:hypothetical protein